MSMAAPSKRSSWRVIQYSLERSSEHYEPSSVASVAVKEWYLCARILLLLACRKALDQDALFGSGRLKLLERVVLILRRHNFTLHR